MAYQLTDGSTVQILSRYSDIIIVKVGEVTKQVSPNQLREIPDDSSVPLPLSNQSTTTQIVDTPTPISSRRGRRSTPITPTSPPNPTASNSNTTNPEISNSDVIRAENSEFNINTASATELNEAINGIGRLRSKRLVERRPAEGYRNWEEVAELNSDLNVDWSAIETDHPFVVFKL